MISQNIDLVAGDFNGTAWRCRSRDNLSSIDEAFSDCVLPTPTDPTPLWGPGSILNCWADVCGSQTPGSQRFWEVNKPGAFSVPRQALGLRSSDQSCHGFCILLIGTTSGPSKLTTTGTFASRNDRRVLHTVLKS